MWFKSLTLFRLTKPLPYTAEALHELLHPLKVKPLGAYTPNSFGWTEALGGGTENLAHGVGQAILIAAKKIQKVIPATVVKERLDEKVRQIEAAESRKCGAKEKRKMKEEILFELYPKALHSSTTIRAYVDTDKQWLIIDSSSAPMVKVFTQLWERTLPGIKIVPFAVKAQLAHRFARWLREEPDGDFNLAYDCALFDPKQSRRTITFKCQEMLSDEVSSHLSTGHLVSQLALSWAERLSFVLDQHLVFRRLRSEELTSEQFEHVPQADPLVRMDADFALMSGMLRQCLSDLVEQLDGLVDMKDMVTVPTPMDEALADADLATLDA